MAAENQNFKIWKGDDIILRCNAVDSENVETFSAIWIMATEVGGTRLLVKTTEGDFSQEGGITPVGGRFEIDIPGTDTDEQSGIEPGNYYHELQVYDYEGKTVVGSTGTVTVEPPEYKRNP